MTFVVQRVTACTECDEPIKIGQLASFSYSQYKHVICPEPSPSKTRPVCPVCFTEIPTSGVCGVCE